MSNAARPEHHTWKLGSPAPFIRPHSEAKHRVIRAYLERYVEVLTANPAQDHFRLTLVDGFAGGGRYLSVRNNEERAGSPLLMLEAMKTAQEHAQNKRTKPFHLDVDYFFIEKDLDAYEYLLQTLRESEFGCLVGSRVQVINSDFLSQVPAVISQIKKPRHADRKPRPAGRAIFVLDQFGWAEVPLPSIKSILAELENAEVVLTFAVDCLIDYMSDNDNIQKSYRRVGISMPSKADAVAKAGPEWRRVIQFGLHTEIPLATGARFYTPFFIRSDDAHRDFWLIHLSGHYRARDVMVDLHWKQSTDFAHFGKAGFDMLGYDQSNDPQWTLQQALPTFRFDTEAKNTSQAELLSQLPELVNAHRDGIQFDNFFASITNRTPVTQDLMKEVLDKLAEEGEILVRDASGKKRKRKRIHKKDDVISPNPQMRLFT